MSTDKRFDDQVSGWLEQSAPGRLPDRVLEATFERTRASRQQISWRTSLGGLRPGRPTVALGGAVALVLVAAVAFNVYTGRSAAGPGGPLPSDDPRSPFLGTWYSTSDADGGTQTMSVRASGEDGVEIVVTDIIASVCDGTPSTMTGNGSVDGIKLVIPEPAYACDDGSEPEALSGPPLQDQLRNLTYLLDAPAGALTVGSASVWTRQVAVAQSPVPQASTRMWPQTSLEEIRQAQERADAGDPDYTWQVDTQLFTDDTWTSEKPGQIEIVDRFLREVLGWEAYVLNPWEGMGRDGVYDVNYDQRYLRCAPDRANPLYPPAPEAVFGELCAPTLDDLTYESVSLDLAQLVRQDSTGIWVINRWRPTAPFLQADPVAVEGQARERLEAFLAARIAGNGAELRVQVEPDADVPLLYATTSGAPYTRYAIDLIEGPRWPYADMTFSIRLFTDDGATVVEQQIRSKIGGWLSMDPTTTTENGQPALVSYTSPDGEATVTAPTTWDAWMPGRFGGHELASGVWMGQLWRASDSSFSDSGEHIALVDPVAYDAWCAANGGSPMLSAPADAAAIAQQVIVDPDFEATPPVAARIGGLEALSMDVTLAPGGQACGIGMIQISRWIHSLGWEPGLRQRLYLVDLPEGMSVRTLAITVQAPEERFEAVIAETAPIIESFEFHPGGGTSSPSVAP